MISERPNLEPFVCVFGRHPIQTPLSIKKGVLEKRNESRELEERRREKKMEAFPPLFIGELDNPYSIHIIIISQWC